MPQTKRLRVEHSHRKSGYGWLSEQGWRVGLLKLKPRTMQQLMVMAAQSGHVQVCRKQIPTDFGVTTRPYLRHELAGRVVDVRNA